MKIYFILKFLEVP